MSLTNYDIPDVTSLHITAMVYEKDSPQLEIDLSPILLEELTVKLMNNVERLEKMEILGGIGFIVSVLSTLAVLASGLPPVLVIASIVMSIYFLTYAYRMDREIMNSIAEFRKVIKTDEFLLEFK